MAWPHINGLPDLYQVRCPSPIPDDWNMLMSIVEGCTSDSTGARGQYYLIDVGNESWNCDEDPYTDDDKNEIHFVSFAKWKELLLLHQNKSKVRFTSLPIEYWVHNNGDKKEFAKLLNEHIAPKGTFGGSYTYYLIKDGNYRTCQDPAPETSFPVLSFAEWKDLIDPSKVKSVHITDDYSVANLKGKNVAIHCRNQGLWNKVVSFIPKCRLQNREWDNYKDRSCITHNEFNGSYGNTEFYRQENYQIITAEEFIAANEKKHEYKVDDWVVVTHDTGGDPVGTVTQIVRIDPDGDIFLRNTSKDQYPSVDKWVHKADTFRPATPDEISKAKGSTTSKVRVDKTNAVIGLKVVRGKDWDYSPQDGGEGNVGVITEYPLYYPKDPGSDWTYVVWANGDGYCYRIGHNNKYDLYVHEEQVVSKTSRPVKPKYDTPIGWKPGDSWRHKDGTCGLSIAVHPKDDDPNMYFIDYGEYGTNYIEVKRINEYVEKGIWIINPEEKSKKQESQTIISKQSKTKQNENIKEGISISTEQCIISKRDYKPKFSAYLPADSARVTAGPRRKGTTVRG